ncbi:MAG: 2-keto-3-deoxygluconate permease [Peptoniphilaceae bacterium]|nr:2-keto-3-deoxygluconate permease [Peptoniphilaceae bacterium]MDY6018971.1 2-keto-3-deoxygluconate permease [Anaerococcus sp.]
MKILDDVKKIPGGLMIVPLLIGAFVNTFFPQSLEIGGFTTAMFKTGANAILGAFLFCNGAQINIKQAGVSLKKGFFLTLIKFIIGAGLGWLINLTFGEIGFLTITPVAIIASLTNSNGGLYAALASEYGDSTDVGAVSILSINDGPFLTMVALGSTGIAKIPLIALVATIIPIIIGFILGNLDEKLANFLKPGTELLIPFFAFPLGANLDFKNLLIAGIPGILLGVICCLLTGFGGYIIMRMLKAKNPGVGWAIGTTAGNSVGTPAALLTIGAISEEVSTLATGQLTAAIIVTAILAPIFTDYFSKKYKQ